MKILVAITTAILLASISPQANSKTGLEILESIEKSEDARIMMHLYLMGVSDGLYHATTALYDEVILCIPDDVTNTQMALVVEKYLKDNPEELHENITTLAFYAMLEAYPCKE